jgi:hypothetical protein
MDMQIMLKEMCKTDLNDSDIKAICKSRGFPEKEATSPDIFENFFLSTIGIKEALNSLTYEEIVFLHLLNKINKEVDIKYFERLYGCVNPSDRYDDRTFNQQYKEIFSKVKNNLIRKGVLIILEREVYHASSKMERWRFHFPPEFADYLPPVVKASRFNKTGNFKNEILRDKLLEIIGGKQKKSPLSNERPFTLTIKDEEKTSMLSGDMTPIKVTLYALSQLKEQEWLPADALTVILKIFIGKESDHPEKICEVGCEWGCLAKVVADGKTYYRLPEDLMEETNSSEHYLQIKPDGTVTLDLMTIPYSALEMLASVSILDVHNTDLRATASLIKIGNAPETFRKNKIFEWLKENSSGFRTAIELAQKRWGKQIIHENLMIARVKDLSLKVLIEKSFADPKILVRLPNDHIAFPCDQLPVIQKLVEKSGHVIKKAGAK